MRPLEKKEIDWMHAWIDDQIVKVCSMEFKKLKRWLVWYDGEIMIERD